MTTRKTFENEDSVMNYYLEDKDTNQVVIFENIVYNVKEYKNLHPGGPEYLEPLFGKSIDKEFVERDHTLTARNIFQELPVIGTLGKPNLESFMGIKMESKYTFDLSKPLMW